MALVDLCSGCQTEYISKLYVVIMHALGPGGTHHMENAQFPHGLMQFGEFWALLVYFNELWAFSKMGACLTHFLSKLDVPVRPCLELRYLYVTNDISEEQHR